MSLKDRLDSQINKQFSGDNSVNEQAQKEIQKEFDKEPQFKAVKNIDEQMSANMTSLGVIDSILADDEINSIFVSGARNIYIERQGKITKSALMYKDDEQLENIIKNNSKNNLEILDKKYVVSICPKKGVNVTATLPPLAKNPSMFVKCYKDKFATCQTLIESSSTSKEIALFVEALSTIKKNIIITGERNTLKTTILSAMAKKTPQNDRVVLIDYKNEIDLDLPNAIVYNFQNIKDERVKRELLDSIFALDSDKVYVNDCDFDDIKLYLKYLHQGYKGLAFTMCAKGIEDALDILAQEIIKNISVYTPEKAKSVVYDIFDVGVLAKRYEYKGVKIEDISEIKKNYIQNIFHYDGSALHTSRGYSPTFTQELKRLGTPVSESIFESGYKHTYYITPKKEPNRIQKPAMRVDLLKKFKKEDDVKQDDALKQIETPRQDETFQFEDNDIQNIEDINFNE